MNRLSKSSLFMLSILLWISYFSSVLADCDDKCTPVGNDCIPGQPSPFDNGGPPCACNPPDSPRGCGLKSCRYFVDDSSCDCTVDTGPVKNRTNCYRFRCTGESGKCETCKKSLPPDCTSESVWSPPSTGGPDCSCDGESSPPGCTLKPCTLITSGFAPCICEAGYNDNDTTFCFNPTCPGNYNITGGGGGGNGAGVAVGQIVNVVFAVACLMALGWRFW